MQPWAWTDLALFIVAGLLHLFVRHGPFKLVLLVLGGAPFFLVRLPLRAFINFYCTSYDRQLPFARRASVFEFYCVNALRWILSYMNADTMGRRLFLSKGTCTWFFGLRRMRYGIEELGDTKFYPVNTEIFKGYWIRSKSRAKQAPHDIAVLCAPGNLLGFASGYAYIEYLSTLTMALVEQGFTNPAIFCLDVDWIQGYRNELNRLVSAWDYVTSQTRGASHILMGDGPGATAALALTLHIAEPFQELAAIERLERPTALVLVSPMAKLAKMRLTNENDFLTNESLAKFSLKVIDPDESTNLYTMPGLLTGPEWWTHALPPRGTCIVYGEEETCGPEIEAMATRMKNFGRVYLDAEPGQVHSWPMLATFVGRSQVTRNVGVARIADRIAFMVLWDSKQQ